MYGRRGHSGADDDADTVVQAQTLTLTQAQEPQGRSCEPHLRTRRRLLLRQPTQRLLRAHAQPGRLAKLMDALQLVRAVTLAWDALHAADGDQPAWEV